MRNVGRIFISAAVLALLFFGWTTLKSPRGQNEHRQAALDVARGQNYMQQRNWEKAIDAFVIAAGDSKTSSEAVGGAVQAMDAQLAETRLPDRLRTAIALDKRLSPRAPKTALNDQVTDYLVEPLAQETLLAEKLLKDRQQFVNQMRDQGESDSLVASATGRPLTEQDTIEAQQLIKQLDVPSGYAKLYGFARPLAYAMDRFVKDDTVYLNQPDVTNEQLDEVGDSCRVLGEALWPVERQLDSVEPDWRSRFTLPDR